MLIKKGETDVRDAVNLVIEDYIESGEMQEQFEEYGLDPQFIYSDES